MTPYPTHIHHFTWATRISLDLPIGFEEDQEDSEQAMAIFADDLDQEDEIGGKVLTRLTAVPEGQDQAYQRLAQTATTTITNHELLSQKELEIDGAPALQQVFSYLQKDIGVAVIRHETYAQLGNLVFTIIGIAPLEKKDYYVEVFDQGAKSARFILL
jgi:hypothetical protein